MAGPTIRQLADGDWGREHLLIVHVPIGKWTKPDNSKPKGKK